MTDHTNDLPETVYIIASGYEWTCPLCDLLNKEIEHKESVTCQVCKKTFDTDAPEHAYG